VVPGQVGKYSNKMDAPTYELVIPKRTIDNILAHFKKTKTRSVDMFNNEGKKRTFFLKNNKLFAKRSDGIVSEVVDGETQAGLTSNDIVHTSIRGILIKELMEKGVPYEDAINMVIDCERQAKGLCPVSNTKCGHPACCPT
jgi:hypothetical protein